MGNPTRSKTSSLNDSRWDMVRHIFWVRNILDLLVQFFTQDWIHNVKLKRTRWKIQSFTLLCLFLFCFATVIKDKPIGYICKLSFNLSISAKCTKEVWLNNRNYISWKLDGDGGLWWMSAQGSGIYIMEGRLPFYSTFPFS